MPPPARTMVPLGSTARTVSSLYPASHSVPSAVREMYITAPTMADSAGPPSPVEPMLGGTPATSATMPFHSDATPPWNVKKTRPSSVMTRERGFGKADFSAAPPFHVSVPTPATVVTKAPLLLATYARMRWHPLSTNTTLPSTGLNATPVTDRNTATVSAPPSMQSATLPVPATVVTAPVARVSLRRRLNRSSPQYRSATEPGKRRAGDAGARGWR
jgi:hypothetical protein